MKVFAAIKDAEVIKLFYEKTEIKLNYLISYFYLDGQAYRLAHEYRNMINELYLDSGAFSVAGGRSKITVTEYSKYLKLFGDRFDQYFNLDDRFDDPDHNQYNQDYLERHLPADAKPIPVVHDTEDPFSEFKYYVDLGHDYIAIGSTINIPNETMVKIKETYPDVKIHFFGKIAKRKLESLYYYSADSTTWADAAAFGEILYLDPEDKEFHKIYMGSTERKDADSDHYKKFSKKEKFDAFLKDTFDFEYGDLLIKKGVYNRWVVNLFYYKELENHLTHLETSQT
jgi:hypothetical protein